jgi:sigma-B regulation protein RsbU (phosphoserine phosphatase)
MSTLSAVRRLNGIASIEAVSRPARTFTGDFYFSHHAHDRVWIALGDVAGKGLPAAVVMAMIQEELEHRIVACASTACDPAMTMTRLHEFLLPLMPRNRFATAVIGTLREDGTLTIVNAGHPAPLIVRANGTIEEIGSTGPILGILLQARWRTYTTRLEEGDALVLYSDGVTESASRGEELGMHGLRKVIAEVGSAPEAIVRRLEGVGDDVTVVRVVR